MHFADALSARLWRAAAAQLFDRLFFRGERIFYITGSKPGGRPGYGADVAVVERANRPGFCASSLC